MVDFGISGFCGRSKERNDAGTLRYMPPEAVMKENGDVEPGIDTWAVGVILYHLLFGRLPFEGNSRTEIIEQITTKEIEFPIDIYVS